MQQTYFKNPFYVIFLGLLLASLFVPAVEFDKICNVEETSWLWSDPLGSIEIMGGLELLLNGFFGVVFMQLGAVGWLANPLFIIFLFGAYRPKEMQRNKRISTGALLLVLSSLLLTNIFPLLGDEGGVCYLSANSPKLGYWLWLGAAALMAYISWKPLHGK